jgi:hypothetical protein
LRLLGVERSGFAVDDACHVFVRVRDEGFVFVRVGAHLLSGGAARGLVVDGSIELLAKVELVRDSSVEAMTVGRDFVHGKTECRAHGSDTLAFDLCFVGLVGAELDFFLGLTTHFCNLGGFTILLAAMQMCKELVRSCGKRGDGGGPTLRCCWRLTFFLGAAAASNGAEDSGLLGLLPNSLRMLDLRL